MRIVHPHGSYDAKVCRTAAVISSSAVGSRDDRGLGQGVVRILRTDAHVQVLAWIRLREEPHEDDLLFERVKDGGNVTKVQCPTC